MWARVRDILFTPHPHERNVLIWLAWFRACWVTGTGIATFLGLLVWLSPSLLTQWEGPALVVFILVVESFFSVLVSADFLEHWLKRWLLGYTYNPRVMAAGELEGFTGPTLTTENIQSEVLLRLWERHKYDVLYFRVLADDLPDIEAIGYRGVRENGFFPALWEGDPGSGRFGGE